MQTVAGNKRKPRDEEAPVFQESYKKMADDIDDLETIYYNYNSKPAKRVHSVGGGSGKKSKRETMSMKDDDAISGMSFRSKKSRVQKRSPSARTVIVRNRERTPIRDDLSALSMKDRNRDRTPFRDDISVGLGTYNTR